LSGTTVVGTESSREEAGRRVAVFLLVIGLAVLVVDVVVYNRDPPSVFNEPPNWTLVELIGGTGGLGLLAGLVLLAWKRIRNLLLTGSFVFVTVAITAIAAFVSIASDSVAVPPAVLQHAPAVAATRQAREALSVAKANWTCVIIRHDSTGPLPTPFLRCANRSEVSYLVDWNGQQFYGFLFSLGTTEPYYPDSCVRHLGGAWWANMWPGDPAKPCAPSFSFEGGP
jgi:hypothetical protein